MPLTSRLPNSSLGLDIYGWFNSGMIVGDTTGLLNLTRIGFDTILRSQTLSLTQSYKTGL